MLYLRSLSLADRRVFRAKEQAYQAYDRLMDDFSCLENVPIPLPGQAPPEGEGLRPVSLSSYHVPGYPREGK